MRYCNPPKFRGFIVRLSDRCNERYAPKHAESQQPPQKEIQRKRRRESSVDSYATDGSYAENPPMSPFSPSASVCDGNEDIDDESDGSSASDRDRARLSTPGRKGKEPARQPVSVHALPKISSVSPKLPSLSSVSSSITQYSNNRLAERARMASLSGEAQPLVANHTKPAPALGMLSNAFNTYTHSGGRRSSAEVERYNNKDRTPPVHTGEQYTDPSLSVRARRATITGAATTSRLYHDSRSAKQEPIEESVSATRSRSRPEDVSSRTVTPEVERVKSERMSPPPLDLNGPERPFHAYRASELDRGFISAPPEAGPSRSRKRSKSSVTATRDGQATTVSADLEQAHPRRRGDRGAPNPVLKMALECGDYVQVSENGFYCRVHGDHLGGTRSVTRHHESVHLNIMVECQYCNAQFSRRDAVLRHQRQSSCKTSAKWKVGKKSSDNDGPATGSP